MPFFPIANNGSFGGRVRFPWTSMRRGKTLSLPLLHMQTPPPLPSSGIEKRRNRENGNDGEKGEGTGRAEGVRRGGGRVAEKSGGGKGAGNGLMALTQAQRGGGTPSG